MAIPLGDNLIEELGVSAIDAQSSIGPEETFGIELDKAPFCHFFPFFEHGIRQDKGVLVDSYDPPFAIYAHLCIIIRLVVGALQVSCLCREVETLAKFIVHRVGFHILRRSVIWILS